MGNIFSLALGRGNEETFKEQTCAEPVWGVVEPYDPINIPTALSVVPWAELIFGEQPAGEIFRGKDHAHIGQATEPERSFPDDTVHKGDDGGTSIDGKHPDRGDASQGQVAVAQRADGGEDDFHAPAGQTALQEIFYKNSNVFHVKSFQGVLWLLFVSIDRKLKNMCLRAFDTNSLCAENMRRNG